MMLTKSLQNPLIQEVYPHHDFALSFLPFNPRRALTRPKLLIPRVFSV